jgi:chromosome partitioning protein
LCINEVCARLKGIYGKISLHRYFDSAKIIADYITEFIVAQRPVVEKTFKVQAVATMLGISADTVRRDSDEADIKVQRQGGDGPKTRLFTIENVFELAAHRRRKNGLIKRSPLIITVYAAKGGVGKTTSAANIGAAFALRGLRVLLVDLDFQANLTMAFGYDPEVTQEEANELGMDPGTVVKYHFGNLLPQWSKDGSVEPLATVIKKPYGEHGPHLIPSELGFDDLEAIFTLERLMERKPELAIATWLQKGLSGENANVDLSQYDVILFDAPPAKNQATRGAMLGSDFVVTPVSMERFSTKSVSYLAKVLGELQRDHGRFPRMITLANFYDMRRARVAAQVVALTTKYPDAWLEKQIATSEEFRKALSDDVIMPVILSRPSSGPAEELRAVANALLEKMEAA